MTDGRGDEWGQPTGVGDTAGVMVWPPLVALVTLVFGFLLSWLAPTFVLRIVLPFEIRAGVGALLLAGGVALAFKARNGFARRARTSTRRSLRWRSSPPESTNTFATRCTWDWG